MGLKKIRTEGGSGGRRGHSNMEHWAYTDEIKTAARSQRRIEDKQAVREPLGEGPSSELPQVSSRLLESGPMSEPNRVLQAALELAPRERAELVDAIAASLDGFDLGDEWEEEIRKRIEDVDSGQVKPIPGEDVLSKAEQRQRGR
jgi:putative addiction module component (TIGR02574 family)